MARVVKFVVSAATSICANVNLYEIGMKVTSLRVINTLTAACFSHCLFRLGCRVDFTARHTYRRFLNNRSWDNW